MKIYEVTREYSDWDNNGCHESHRYTSKEKALEKALEMVNKYKEYNNFYYEDNKHDDLKIYTRTSKKTHKCELCGADSNYTRYDYIIVKELDVEVNDNEC